MPEKPPDERDGTGEQGDFERRDLLKGITLGAAGFAGAGAAVNGVMAQDQDPQENPPASCPDSVIDYVATVQQGEPATESQNVFPDGPTSTLDLAFGVTFEPTTDDRTQSVVDGTVPLGYYVAVITRESREIVTRAFEEYEAHASAENVNPDASGAVELRKSISLKSLGASPPQEYVAVLAVMDLRGCCCDIECKPFAVRETQPGPASDEAAGNESASDQAAGDEAASDEAAGDEAAGNETEATPTTTPAGNQTG